MPVQIITCEYKKIKGCSIKADIFLPDSQNPPLVIYFHGGALISGSRKYLPAYQAQRLTQAGFAVASFDYRLAPETKLEEIFLDVRDALRWARGKGAANFAWNPQRIGVIGGSAGGYISLMTGTFEEKPDAIVSLYGYGDILGEWYSLPSQFYCQRPLISKLEAEAVVGRRIRTAGGNRRYIFYFYTRQQGIWPQEVSGYDQRTIHQELKRYCPVENITATYPPTLLIHGDQDTDVPYEQSLLMSAALNRHGVENRLITVQGAGHAFDMDPNHPEAVRIFKHGIEFFRQYL